MTDRRLELLPAPVSRAILMAPVPAPLRALFARLPAGCEVQAKLPGGVADVPLCARQIVKLATLGGALHLSSAVVAEGEAIGVTLRRGSHALHLGAQELSTELRPICERILEALFDAPSLAGALQRFAAESATRSTLSTLTGHMLRAPDLDHALYAMLSGVTSGFGLAFHRAALFVLDPAGGAFVGSKAIGPADEEEAHRIWEEMEVEDRELSQIVQDYAAGKVDSRFEGFVRGLSIRAGSDARDVVTTALASSTPVLFDRDELDVGGLRALSPARVFVLAAVAPRSGDDVRALVFADDAWSRQPIAPERLERLGELLGELALVWENLALLARVEKLARVDTLTGVHNRRVFEERLKEEQSRARRGATALSVLVLDIDRFKEINDTRGHAAGDDALRRLAALLAPAVREHDAVARIGGDEFAVILPGVARDEALAVATRIGMLARDAGVSVSIGGATFPDDTPEPGQLVPVADANLYAAKRSGRGRARLGAGVGSDFPPA